MAAARRPRCFVAMAFGRDDTTALYERQIRPILRKCGVTAVIIDRRQSNDDLNNQIIGELDSCDFVIADLTYARQSVYYEAGYAQRAGDIVVYTVRKDHIRGQAEDLRVHFDLQMKPLVAWSSPRDPSFGKRLLKRLRATVLKRLAREGADEAALATSRATFAALSQNDRLALMRRVAMATLQRAGFGQWNTPPRPGESQRTYPDLARSPWIASGPRHRGDEQAVISIRATASLVKSELEALGWLTSPFGSLTLNHGDGKLSGKRVVVHNLAFALRPVTARQVESVLTNLTPGPRSGIYVRRDEVNVGGAGQPPAAFLSTVSFIGGVRSEVEFREALRALLPDVLATGQLAAEEKGRPLPVPTVPVPPLPARARRRSG